MLRSCPTLKKVIRIFLVLKAFSLIFIGLAYHSIPFCQVCREANFVYPPDQALNLSTAYQTWDAQHYLYLAAQGYAPDQGSNAFYPLLPFLIRLGQGLLLGQTFLAGLLITNLISLAAVVMFYHLAEQHFPPRLAFLACLYLFAFPASFYLHLIYTEGLFLLLATAAFYLISPAPLSKKGADQGHTRFILLLLISFLLPLSRANGIFVALPLLYALIFENSTDRLRFQGDMTEPPSLKTRLTLALGMSLSFMAGISTYFGLMYLTTRSPWAGFEAQQYFFSNYRVSNLLNPHAWLMNNFVDIQFTWHGFNTSLLNRLFFLSFLGLLALTYRQLNRSFFIYTLLIGLVTALSGELDSFPRYMLTIFPIFMALAATFPRRPAYFLLPLAGLQMIFLTAHSLNYWFA